MSDSMEEKATKELILPPSERSSEDVELPPEGGTKAWLTVFGGWLTVFATFGYVNAFGVYQDLYTRSGAASAERISWIGSTQIFFLIGMGLPSGKLFDMGYFRSTMIVGSVLYVFSMFMLSLAHPDKYYQIFLSQGLGMGIGSGLLYVPAMSIQAHHWHKRRPMAMGIVITGTSFGGVVYPIMLNQLIHGKTGFAWGVRASAFLSMGLLFIAYFMMFPGPPKPKASIPSFKILLTDAPYMFAIIGSFVAFLGFFFPYFYLQLYAILKGVDSTLAFYTLAIMNTSSIFGRTLPNLLAERIGIFNTLVPITAITGILVFAVFGITEAAGTVVFAILYGFFSGSFLSLLPPLAASLARDASEIGVRMGFAFFVAAFGCLVGGPINGTILGPTFNWSKPIVFSGVTLLGGAGLIFIARIFQQKRTMSQRI